MQFCEKESDEKKKRNGPKVANRERNMITYTYFLIFGVSDAWALGVGRKMFQLFKTNELNFGWT